MLWPGAFGAPASAMRDDGDARTRTDLPLMLEDVSLLAREVTILDHVSLTFAPGAPTMLIGPNGSGKSSLMRVAMGLVPPTAGASPMAAAATCRRSAARSCSSAR